MKKLLLSFALLFSVLSFSQDLSLDYKEYSYTEFFKMIDKEKDSVFKLNNALIIYNKKTDQRFSYTLNINTNEVLDIDSVSTISVNKHVELNNVHFQNRYAERVNENVSVVNGGLTKIHFTKGVEIRKSASLSIYNCIFDSTFVSTNFDVCKVSTDFIRSKNLFNRVV